MNRFASRKSRKWIIGGMLAIAGLIFSVGTFTVFASYGLTNDLPSNNENFQAAGNNGAIDLHLKNLDVAQVTKNKFAAYYPSWNTSADNKSITIKGKNPKPICHIDNDITGHIYVKITINGQSTPDSGQYNIPMQQVCETNQFYNHTFPFPNGNLINNPGSSHNRADIEVTMVGTPQKNAAEGNDLNYTVSLSGGGTDSGRLALKENRREREFGLRSTYTDNKPQPNNRDVRLTLPFGYRCDINVAAPTERVVKVYDADAVFGETFMWVTRDGVKLNHDDYENYVNPYVSPDPRSDGGRRNVVGMNDAEFDNNAKRWRLQGSNEDYNQLTIKREAIRKGHDYQLVVFNTGAGGSLSPHFNTLSVAIPQDGIYSNLGLGNDPCNYSLRPTVSVNPDTFVYYPDFRVSASIQKTGNGPVPEDHPWQLFTVRYDGEPSTRALRNDSVANGVTVCSTDILPAGWVPSSCNKVADRSYDAQPTHVIDPYTSGGPYPVGTRVCFFARIQNPTYLEDDNDQWHYSDLDCSVSAKKPRVQFLGSDLRIGGIATSSYFSMRGTNYGSWAEYGVLTAGANALVSSGNSLRDGNSAPPGSWNGLTFANTPTYGNYNPVPSSSSAYTYFKSLPPDKTGAPNGQNPSAGVYDLGATGNIGTIRLTSAAQGSSLIVRKTGQLRISNDIEVENTGVTGASNLSQVVIVADSIVIGPGVERIDAWLVTSPGGHINTCATGQTSLTSTTCPEPLTVNGPIYTNRLMLRRTAGNNPPNQFNEPAERFNLRPDAQLWAYTYANKADYAQTDFVQELPPRY